MMVLKYLQYRYFKARLAAYLDGELPVKTRRFIARQIDENPLAYQEYLRARQTKQELESSLPIFGKPEIGQLDAIWANIQDELQKEARPSLTKKLRPHYSLGYGLAVMLIALLLLAPFALDVQRVTASAAPNELVPNLVTTIPATTAVPTIVALMGELRVTDDLSSPLQNTPATHTPGQNH